MANPWLKANPWAACGRKFYSPAHPAYSAHYQVKVRPVYSSGARGQWTSSTWTERFGRNWSEHRHYWFDSRGDLEIGWVIEPDEAPLAIRSEVLTKYTPGGWRPDGWLGPSTS